VRTPTGTLTTNVPTGQFVRSIEGLAGLKILLHAGPHHAVDLHAAARAIAGAKVAPVSDALERFGQAD
jgi:hypothetical protein